MKKGIKQISMIDMARKETRKEANKREGKQANKKWCPQGTNVVLGQMSIASLC